MKIDELLVNKEGNELFLLGNEAIARGAIEAGVRTASTYPGTPSSEVGDVLSLIARKAGMYFEFSTNEKVAFEVAFSSAISGLRSLVFMKHVGLNVASDPFMSAAYTGVKAGLVVMSADDPSMFSSQNEQDNRHYGEIAHIPVIEPSNPQEAKDYLIKAFEISEKENIPVLFRTTTRVSHMRGMVKLGDVRKDVTKPFFKGDSRTYVTLPSSAYGNKKRLIEKMERLVLASDASDLNRIEKYGSGEIGIITSGAGYNALMDVIKKRNLNFTVLKLGFTNPLPENLVEDFLKKHPKVIIVEELDPVVESKVRTIAQMKRISSEIYGKLDGYFSKSYEYSPDTVEDSLSKILGFKKEAMEVEAKERELPARPPVLCPGCPHRATYYAVKRAVKMLNLKDIIYSSDIGCYSLGAYEPYNEAHLILSMGSSIGAASGFSSITEQPIIAFIGDSTFFHTGIPALINAVHNGRKIMVVVLDNRTTAMTGRQPNPGMPINAMGDVAPELSIENIAKAIGVKYVETVDPYDLKSTLQALTGGLKQEGVSMVIAKRECAIIRDQELRKKKEWSTYKVDLEKCGKCMNCLENFSCPAISLKDGEVVIDQNLCDGCGVCAQAYVCPFRAIEVAEDEE